MPRSPTSGVLGPFSSQGYPRLLAEEGEGLGVQVRREAPGSVFRLPGGMLGPIDPLCTDPDLGLKAMSRQRVAARAPGRRLARAANGAMAEAHRAFPDRLAGFATLPLPDPALGMKEPERVAGPRGIRGAYPETDVQGTDPSRGEGLPVSRRMEALPVSRRMEALPVSRRMEALRLPLFLMHPDAKGARRKPSAHLRRFTDDAISHDPGTLPYLIRKVRAGRVMPGTDHRFKMGHDRPVGVGARLAGLPRAHGARILAGNAAKPLRLV